MTTTWSSGIPFQPMPPHGGEEDDSNCGIEFTFVDFLPECRDPGGFLFSAVYDPFRSLVDRANQWLQANRKLRVVTCESVVFKNRRDEVQTTKEMNYRVRSVHKWDGKRKPTDYIKGLRLWLSEEKKESKTAQQIGYWTLVPREVEPGGLFKQPRFETLDEVIRRFNSSLHSSPNSGRIINVQTEVIKMPDYDEIDPELTNWEDRGTGFTLNKRCLCVIRVFYEFMTGSPQEIGVKDFIPDRVAEGGTCSPPDYEPFADVFRKASDWCSTQQGLRICNAQTVPIKIKKGAGSFDTQETGFNEHVGEFSLRILRVAYTRPRTTDVFGMEPFTNGLTQLSCRTFEPVLVRKSLLCGTEYETLQETKQRITAWLKATGARVLSAETIAIPLRRDSNMKLKHETSYNRNRLYRIFVLRLYLNGSYREPPPEMLPPEPELQQTVCCVIL